MAIKLDIISLAIDADMNPNVQEFSKNKILIGRGKNVDLHLDGDDISSKHAIIYLNEDGSLSIEDLGSLNGTSVGDRKIDAHEKFPIGKKDRIMIGDYLIKATVSKDSPKKEEVNEEAKESKDDNELKESSKNQDASNNIAPKEEPINSKLDITEDEGIIEENADAKEALDLEEETEISNDMVEELELENILSNENIAQDDTLSVGDFVELNDEDNIFELDEDMLDDNNQDVSQSTTNNDAKEILEDKKSQDVLISQEELINKEKKELDIFTNNQDNIAQTSNEASYVKSDVSSSNESCLIISGTANENIFDINLEAIRLFTVEGKCKRFGVAISDVIVSLNDEKAITDKNGYFKFTDIEENTPITLKAEKNGFVFENKNLIGVITENTSVTFEGIKTCIISGKILYNGKGLDGVVLSNNLDQSIMTSSDGSFCIKNIKEGCKYIIKPEKENFVFDFEPTERVLKEDTTFVINATKLITISGYIKYKGAPISDVIIDAGELGKTLTDKNGYYEFKNIKEGTQYSLKAYKEGFKFQKA